MKVPKGRIKESTLVKHGHERIDPYFWMNERDSEEVLAHIADENNYTTQYFEEFNALQEQILDEFHARINPNDVSSPFFIQGKQFQIRNKEGYDYGIIYELNAASESVFLDENERAKNKKYYDLASWELSDDTKLLAISEDFIGRRNYTITIRNNSDQSFLNDKITNTDGSIVWLNDGSALFYVKKDSKTLREFQVYKHILGTETSQDELIFEEVDERFNVYISKSLSGAFVEIHSVSSTSSETYLLDATKQKAELQLFLAKEKDHLYTVFPHEDGFFIQSNKNAKNNQVLFSKTIPSAIEQCEVILPHSADILIENLLVLKKYIVLEQRATGLQQLGIFDIASKQLSFIDFKEETYHLALGVNENYHTDEIYFSYNSLTTPTTVFRYSLSTSEKHTFFRKTLLDPTFNSENYESKRIWITANDGTKVAVSMVHKKGLELAQAPLYIYGYGSYGITYPDTFSAYRLTLINRGFVFAIAHIRGEKYLGEHWYESGKFLKKRNTFTDFINAAEYLSMKGYCDPSKIYAQGGSAGGLLMGAVTNMAPYLWKGIIAQVPFVDVVTTMLDETIPLTVGEYEEWGNPNEEDYYWYMLSYSPYDNVKPVALPAMYITTGYHDSQVQYWEPLKWVAKLRAKQTNNAPILFECNMDAGHGGGSGRTSERLEIAKVYAFILNLEGINQ